MSEPSPFSLAGKLAVVSGGTRGIGLAIARGLGRAGAEVVLIGRDRAKAEESKASLMGRASRSPFSWRTSRGKKTAGRSRRPWRNGQGP